MRLVILAAGLGTRMRPATLGRPKILLEVSGATVLDRIVELADDLGLDPLVVTRPEFAEECRRPGLEVLVEERPTAMIDTLYYARCRVGDEPFCWIGGDMLFSEPAPMKSLIEAHETGGHYASFFYCRTDRFKAKLVLEPEPKVAITRQGQFSYSIPNFLLHSAAAFTYMQETPRELFLQRGIESGESILIREYPYQVFELDTPLDLEGARRFFEPCPSLY
jgi:NDP-sugar pyrophosphorylase family protein